MQHRGSAADLMFLQELQELMGEDMDQLLDTFEESMVEQMPKMKKAIAEGHSDELRRLAHTMKGASASVGGQALSDCLYELERCASRGELDQARQFLGAVEQAYAEYALELKKWRQGAGVGEQ